MKKTGWSVYPNLEKWINENCESVSEFAWLVAVSPTTMYKFLKGKSDLRYETVCAIMRVTHMRFDVIFEKAKK